jgi:hypothetical protein
MADGWRWPRIRRAEHLGYPGRVRVLRTESSSLIYDVEYDEAAEVLRVRFHSGGQLKPGCWEYSKVPAWLFDKLCEEEAGAQSQRGLAWFEKGQKPFSVGTFYHRHIKPVFPETRIRPPRDPNSPKKPRAVKAKAEPKAKARRVPPPRPPEPRRPRRVLH